MGNDLSSVLKPSKHTAKLFDSQGNFQRLKLPVKAAELMLEAPGNVITSIEELRRTRRILALKADEELQAGKLYLMMPSDRMHCKVSKLEMELIDAGCRNKGMPRRPKVFPMVTDSEGKKEEGRVKLLGESDTGFPGHRLRVNQQWRPMLEPIYEGARY